MSFSPFSVCVGEEKMVAKTHLKHRIPTPCRKLGSVKLLNRGS